MHVHDLFGVMSPRIAFEIALWHGLTLFYRVSLLILYKSYFVKQFYCQKGVG